MRPVVIAGGLFVVAIALAVLIVGYSFAEPSSKRSKRRSNDIGAELAQLRSEVAQLKTQAARAPSITMVAAESSESPHPGKPEPPTEEERRVASERSYVETKAHFERVYAVANGLTEWGRATESALRSTLSSAPDELARQVTALDCRGDMCRVETEHASAIESASFMDEMEARPGFQGSRFVRIRKRPGTETYEFFVQPREAPRQ